jgi:hypothetical protein
MMFKTTPCAIAAQKPKERNPFLASCRNAKEVNPIIYWSNRNKYFYSTSEK